MDSERKRAYSGKNFGTLEFDWENGKMTVAQCPFDCHQRSGRHKTQKLGAKSVPPRKLGPKADV